VSIGFITTVNVGTGARSEGAPMHSEERREALTRRAAAPARPVASPRGTGSRPRSRAGRPSWPPPRVRSHCRFRNRVTEHVSESGIKWMWGLTKRQCDRAPPHRGPHERRVPLGPVADGPAAGIGLALRNLALISRSIGERYIFKNS
jgi:hypothetical protein